MQTNWKDTSLVLEVKERCHNYWKYILKSATLLNFVLQYLSVDWTATYMKFQQVQDTAYPETNICPSQENAQARTGAECPLNVHLYLNSTPENTRSKLLHKDISDKTLKQHVFRIVKLPQKI